MKQMIRANLASDFISVMDEARDSHWPYGVQPKYDGIRCLAFNGKAVGRSGKLLANKNLQELFAAHPEWYGRDGELIYGSPTDPDCYRKTQSCINSHHAPITQIRWYVFDQFHIASPFDVRHRNLRHKPPHDFIRPVPLNKAQNRQQLFEAEQHFLAQGYEGAIVRRLNSYYKQGRSTKVSQEVMKIKHFIDGEFEVIGAFPLQSNLNEATINSIGLTERPSHASGKLVQPILGGLICRYQDESFRVGTGFTGYERAMLWSQRDNLPGRFAKVKYTTYGAKDLPRHPVFLGFRSPEDLG